VTDAGLKELKECTELKALCLDQTSVTDAGLKDLKEFKQLVAISITGTKVTAAGVKELEAALPACTVLR
jgi:hypothetical protein